MQEKREQTMKTLRDGEDCTVSQCTLLWENSEESYKTHNQNEESSGRGQDRGRETT